MRLRIPELFEEQDPPVTPYRVAKESRGRLSLGTVYRLKAKRGRVRLFDAYALQALCDVLGVTPGELFESEPGDGAHDAKPTTAARKAKPAKAPARKRAKG